MKLLSAVLLLAVSATGVRVGDEEYTRIPGGNFIVFSSQAVDIIDPVTLEVVKTSTVDQDGKNLTNADNRSRSWNDAIFVVDANSNKRYVFVNEGDIYGKGSAAPYSYVSVLDVDKQEFVARIKVRPNPVHSYSVAPLGEVWVHSDANATFDVITVANLSLAAEPVPALRKVAAHGKLMWEPDLLPLAYATNVGEQYIYELNLTSRTLLNAYDFSGDVPAGGSCVGTHSIQYSSENQHLYVECTGSGQPSAGIIEWDTVDKQFVELWTNSSGSMVALPFEEYVVVTNKGANRASVFYANGESEMSTERLRINVPGNPAGVEYYPNGPFVREEATNDTLRDYWLYFPLARNTNMYNINATAALGKDVTTAGYNAAPFDCKYNMSSADQGPTATLQLALGSDGAHLTPECGSCAPQTCDAQNSSLSGFAFVNMATVFARADQGLQTTADFIPAGSVNQGMPYSAAANQCSYGQTYRSSKRGGQYIATVAHCPQPSLYIIDGSQQRLAGFVKTTGDRPSRVVYAAPPSTSDAVAAFTG